MMSKLSVLCHLFLLMVMPMVTFGIMKTVMFGGLFLTSYLFIISVYDVLLYRLLNFKSFDIQNTINFSITNIVFLSTLLIINWDNQTFLTNANSFVSCSEEDPSDSSVSLVYISQASFWITMIVMNIVFFKIKKASTGEQHTILSV